MNDERYKQLMQQVGLPESQSLLGALQQAVMEATLAEREACAKACDELDTYDEFDPGSSYAEAIRARTV